MQMTPYLLHSRTLPHLYGTATSRCPHGQLGELRRTCTWEPSTFIQSELQCRHIFIEELHLRPRRLSPLLPLRTLRLPLALIRRLLRVLAVWMAVRMAMVLVARA